jgi:hypothetical protein
MPNDKTRMSPLLNPGPLAEPKAWIRDDGAPGAERMEMPDNRNDQARAHLQARDSAEEKI